MCPRYDRFPACGFGCSCSAGAASLDFLRHLQCYCMTIVLSLLTLCVVIADALRVQPPVATFPTSSPDGHGLGVCGFVKTLCTSFFGSRAVVSQQNLKESTDKKGSREGL